jgi:hypothetical protein
MRPSARETRADGGALSPFLATPRRSQRQRAYASDIARLRRNMPSGPVNVPYVPDKIILL